MRILLDQNVPAPLRYWLVGNPVETAYERGWCGLADAELLEKAEGARFEVLITTNKGVRSQQNPSGRRLAVIVISPNDWTRIRNWKSVVVDVISGLQPGSILEVEIPSA